MNTFFLTVNEIKKTTETVYIYIYLLRSFLSFLALHSSKYWKMTKPVEMAERKGVKSRLIDWDQFDPVEGYYECVSSRVSLQYRFYILLLGFSAKLLQLNVCNAKDYR